MEQFCVLVDGHVRTVCGVTLETTCDELRCALCQATGKRYDKHRIYEVWQSFERLVGLDEPLLKLRGDWGHYESDVTFVMKTRNKVEPTGLFLPHVNASKLKRRRGLRGVSQNCKPGTSFSKLQLKKLCLQQGKLRSQAREINSLKRELAQVRDAVDRFHLTDAERSELFDLRSVSAKQQSQLEEMRLWEQQLDVQTSEKETYDREIERLRDDVAMRQKELTRYQDNERRLLGEVKALTETQNRSMQIDADEMETDSKIKQLRDKLEERMKANAKQAVKMKEARLALEETERSIGERQRYIEYLKKQVDGQRVETEESSSSDVLTESVDIASDRDSLHSFFESSSWENDEGSYV